MRKQSLHTDHSTCAVQFVFMDNETYEETRLKRDEAWAKYMKEGTEAGLLFWNGKVISVDPPITMELEVTDTDPGLKGNTASGSARCQREQWNYFHRSRTA